MMRFLLILFFSFSIVLGFGQSVTAPEPKTFLRSTNGQDASGFSLSGFNSTDVLLCAIGLPQAPSGTTFYITNTTGLTASIGYTLTGNKTRLTFTGTQSNINNALASLKINTTATNGNIQISISATVNPAGFFYLPTNGHFYRPISTGVFYSQAKINAANTTFKGQRGYLVTITSADEDLFIFNNVPQSNIWFALTDSITEGTWRIDDGPERGTIVRIGTTNQQGVYNNWAGGEPNNWGGNEDYAVTKWGGSQWNDLNFNYNNPYVIEYGTWTNPDDQTFTEFYSSSVIHTNGDVFRVQYTFNFNNLTPSRFAIRTQSQNNGLWTPFSPNFTPLNNIGRVDMTSLSDTAKSVSGVRATTSVGQVEWAIINPYNPTLGGHQLLIDQREFDGTGVSPNNVTSIHLFDIYDGPVIVNDVSGWWKIYLIPGNLTNKIQSSTFQAQLRLQDGWYGTRAEFSFTNQMGFKPQRVQFQNPIQDTITAMLNRIVTVSDVYLAFREFSDGGIFGNTSNYFTSGIQFMNADIDENGQFNEADCFKLLRHLLGQESLLSSNDIQSFMKLLPKSDYDAVTKSNWTTFPNTSSDSYSNLTLSSTQLLNAFTFNVFWKGDVNMSHSPVQSTITNVSSQTTLLSSTSISPTAYIISEIVGDSLVVLIKFNPNTNDIVGTQFRINYDNSILKYAGTEFKTINSSINFGNDRGDNINLGSLDMSGGVLNNTTEYKMSFKLNKKIINSLGLVSIANNEAVTKSGETLKIKIE